MGASPRTIVEVEHAAYLERLRLPDDGLVADMKERARHLGLATCRPATATLLEIVARAGRARRVLDVGTGVGRSALALASTSEETHVTSVDRDAAVLGEARDFLERAGMEERVRCVEGEAADVLPRLEGHYDLMFLDIDKVDDRRCLDLGLQLLRVGATVVVDHLLWRGRVAVPGDEVDDNAQAAYSFNGYFMSHPQLSSVILPVDDGVGLAVKLKALVTELGGPF